MKTRPFSKTYRGVTVLDVPELEFMPGRIYGVIGANGSGKSTFAKILTGILDADRRGRVLESAVTSGYMPQHSYAFRMSTRANILLGGSDGARAEALMDALQISHLASRRGDRLSGGETARMALARILMRQYGLLILDEPTAAMDMETTAAAERLILNYTRESGCALILITHSLQQAGRLADEILFFDRGQIVEAGPKEQVFEAPKNPKTRQFLEFYGSVLP